MRWNWQQTDWPNFCWDEEKFVELESKFLFHSGEANGSVKHLDQEKKDLLRVEIITGEALKTSAIEGEILNRASVQSSIKNVFGLSNDDRHAGAAENAIAQMMGDLYKNYGQPLSHEKLFLWHQMLMERRTDLTDIGSYRTHSEPMQVVSGMVGDPKVHFEAPPSQNVAYEMDAFLAWFTDTSPAGGKPLPALTRAAIAHLYFVCIHPFEDGNGRIGRAVAEKALAENLQQPTLIALSQSIGKDRKEYYRLLEISNKQLDITRWITYFAQTILEAQIYSMRWIEFLIGKTKLFDAARGRLSSRQEKVLVRMFREGIDGFKGGLSVNNYMTITKASRATSTRDLQDLVAKNILLRTGTLKSTRYHLNLVYSASQPVEGRSS